MRTVRTWWEAFHRSHKIIAAVTTNWINRLKTKYTKFQCREYTSKRTIYSSYAAIYSVWQMTLTVFFFFFSRFTSPNICCHHIAENNNSQGWNTCRWNRVWFSTKKRRRPFERLNFVKENCKRLCNGGKQKSDWWKDHGVDGSEPDESCCCNDGFRFHVVLLVYIHVLFSLST